MFIITIDCGTTNSRLYIVDINGKIITKVSKRIGIRNVAINGDNKILKHSLRTMFDQALRKTGINISEIHCVFSSGVITSELGLKELPHLWAPCSLDTLAANIVCFESLDIFPLSILVYFVRGIKNYYEQDKFSLRDIGTLDVMRGEETQIAGLLGDKKIELPAIVLMLSSHTKLIPIDNEERILGSITTLSGQIYEAIIKETLVGKSVRDEGGFDYTGYFNTDIFDVAYEQVTNFGFLRGLMCIRLMDILVHIPWYERKFFLESLLAAEDMSVFSRVKDFTNLSIKNYILIGPKPRCFLYKHILETKISPGCNVNIIAEETQIDQLSIKGVLFLAKKAKIF